MRRWLSVMLLVLVITAGSEILLVGGNLPAHPGVVSMLSHGDGT